MSEEIKTLRTTLTMRPKEEPRTVLAIAFISSRLNSQNVKHQWVIDGVEDSMSAHLIYPEGAGRIAMAAAQEWQTADASAIGAIDRQSHSLLRKLKVLEVELIKAQGDLGAERARASERATTTTHLERALLSSERKLGTSLEETKIAREALGGERAISSWGRVELAKARSSVTLWRVLTALSLAAAVVAYTVNP